MSKFDKPLRTIGWIMLAALAVFALWLHSSFPAWSATPEAEQASYNACFNPNADVEELGIDCSMLSGNHREVAIENALSEALTDAYPEVDTPKN